MTDRIDALRIEPILHKHQRKNFDCGEDSLNEYISLYARQNDTQNIARTFVAVDDDHLVLGYYSISAASIEFAELPEELAKHLPGYPVPAARIGRLAIDQSVQGQGLGARLLTNALQRICTASGEMGIKIVLVDALNAKARAFYAHFGFIPLPGEKTGLFLPIETVTGIFQSK